MDFSQSVVVVTGAGSGIGRQVALQFAQAGARLAINDFDAERLEETARAIELQKGDVYHRAFDVSHREEMCAFATEVEERFGRVDIVINNAGVSLGQMDFEEIPYEDFQWIIDVNLWGVIHGTMAFLPMLRNRPEAKLVNVCSSFGMLAVPGQAAYCASKFAVRGFTDSLRLELMDSAIRVTLVCPSQVRTNIVRNGRHRDEAAKQKLIHQFDTMLTRITPADAARTILRGLQKNREFVPIGQDAKIFNFASRFVPQWIIKVLTRRALKQLASHKAPVAPDVESTET